MMLRSVVSAVRNSRAHSVAVIDEVCRPPSNIASGSISERAGTTGGTLVSKTRRLVPLRPTTGTHSLEKDRGVCPIGRRCPLKSRSAELRVIGVGLVVKNSAGLLQRRIRNCRLRQLVGIRTRITRAGRSW
ncbi:MAG: hypothetical protein [Cressdnaviricota sp.]|nr:MAG: hypothetical protein [Cressdnaviricota sp.]